MVQRVVSKIDPHIEKATEVETSREPSTVVGLDLEEMLPTIPLFWVMTKHFYKNRRCPRQIRFGEGDSFILDMASDSNV